MLGTLGYLAYGLPIQCTYNLAGRAEDKRIVGYLFSFGDQRSRADQTIAANPGTVQDNSSHPHQRIIANGASVKDRPMPDGAALSNRRRKTGVGVESIKRHLQVSHGMTPESVETGRAAPRAFESW